MKILSETEVAILHALREDGIAAFSRLIHPRALHSHYFIVVHYGPVTVLPNGYPALGLSLYDTELELCTLAARGEFPNALIKWYDLNDPDFYDSLRDDIITRLCDDQPCLPWCKTVIRRLVDVVTSLFRRPA